VDALYLPTNVLYLVAMFWWRTHKTFKSNLWGIPNMYVLGLKCHGHDTGASIIKEINGEIDIVAISESRLNRRKHSYAYPMLSIQYVLDHFELSGFAEIDLICIDKHLEIFPEKDSQFGFFDAWRRFGKTEFYDVDSRESYLIEQAINFPSDKLRWVSHVDAHAASAYYVSGFNDAAVLTMEGGMGLYDAKGTDLNIVNRSGYLSEEYRNRVPQGGSFLTKSMQMNISHLYDFVTNRLALDHFSAGKTMALAAFKERVKESNYLNVPKERPLDFSFDYASYISGLKGKIDTFKCHAGENYDEKITGDYWVNISREAQETLEEEVLGFVRNAADKVKSKNLCLAGGVALSCVTNRKVLDSGIFENVFVQPAASDEGIALGCALWGYYKELGGQTRVSMNHAYLGTANDPATLEGTLEKWGFEHQVQTTEHVANLLAEGSIVARVSGASEFGPRALGNRSILADPRIEDIMEIVNTRVKHRERFRPFAPSCHEDKTTEYFKMPVSSPFMLIATSVVDAMEDKIPGIMHVDGSSRVQTVTAQQNPGYYDLIEEFGKKTGIYVLLNTSYNDNGEAIVETYQDALLSFIRTGVDYLYVEGILVSRPSPEKIESLKVELAAHVESQVQGAYEKAKRDFCNQEKLARLEQRLEKISLCDLVLSIFRRYQFVAKINTVKSNSMVPQWLWVSRNKLGGMLVRSCIYTLSFPVSFLSDCRRLATRIFKFN
jgi:carbamoyltransferase